MITFTKIRNCFQKIPTFFVQKMLCLKQGALGKSKKCPYLTRSGLILAIRSAHANVCKISHYTSLSVTRKFDRRRMSQRKLRKNAGHIDRSEAQHKAKK